MQYRKMARWTIAGVLMLTLTSPAQAQRWRWRDNYGHGYEWGEYDHSQGRYYGARPYGGMIGGGFNRRGYGDSARTWQQLDNWHNGGPLPGTGWNR